MRQKDSVLRELRASLGRGGVLTDAVAKETITDLIDEVLELRSFVCKVAEETLETAARIAYRHGADEVATAIRARKP